ncbi:hypothetical protein E2C01_056886 [Portunus trituberculatus]|uniref:Uncharacterized protein n=1 Tax=Portunus trituberculatus TaxID=210409 RepID=A0A5B7H0D0_PORTR|nr:hypothetical protein [Portunus trituberculatus]
MHCPEGEGWDTTAVVRKTMVGLATMILLAGDIECRQVKRTDGGLLKYPLQERQQDFRFGIPLAVETVNRGCVVHFEKNPHVVQVLVRREEFERDPQPLYVDVGLLEPLHPPALHLVAQGGLVTPTHV